MTPERRAALEMIRDMAGATVYLENASSECLADIWTAAQVALSDYPANDTCELTRQELIAEVARLKKRDTGAVC